jgi:hypothetical protein
MTSKNALLLLFLISVNELSLSQYEVKVELVTLCFRLYDANHGE